MNARSLLAGSVAGVVALAAAAPSTYAQSAQPFSVQASILGTKSETKFVFTPGVVSNVDFTAFGIEVQGRYTWVSPWSVGIGLQASAGTANKASTLNELLVGGFVEPRFSFDVGSERFAPYVAARVGYLKDTFTVTNVSGDVSSDVFAYGAGGGLLISVSKIINVDIGAAVTQNNVSGGGLGSYNFLGYVVKAGVSVGFGHR